MGVQGESGNLPMAVVQDAEVPAVGCKGRGSPLPCPPARPPKPIRRRRPMGVQGESGNLPLAVVQDAEVLAVGCKGRGQPFALPAAASAEAFGEGGSLRAQAGRWVQGEPQSPWPPGLSAGAEPGGSAGDGQSPRKVRAVVPAHTLYSFLSLYL